MNLLNTFVSIQTLYTMLNTSASASQLSVYAVDSSPKYRMLLQSAFAQFLPDYSLRLFENSEALLQAFDGSAKPGLLLLDAHLPEVGGCEAVRRIRQHANGCYLPVVLMSHTDANAEVQACYAAGANSFLVKPTSVETLRPLMQSLCFYWFALNQRAE